MSFLCYYMPSMTTSEGVSGGAFGGYTQSNVAARRVVPSEAGVVGWVIEAWE